LKVILLCTEAVGAPSNVMIPFGVVPFSANDPVGPVGPDVPLDPDDPVEPLVPLEPLPPDAPAKLIVQELYVPDPKKLLIVTKNAPVPEL
jgi:hypothetical protein